MKRILIQAILLIASVAVHAQTQLKPNPLSNYSLGGTTLSFSDTTLWAKQEQSTFFLGWHWIGPKKQANNVYIQTSFNMQFHLLPQTAPQLVCSQTNTKRNTSTHNTTVFFNTSVCMRTANIIVRKMCKKVLRCR